MLSLPEKPAELNDKDFCFRILFKPSTGALWGYNAFSISSDLVFNRQQLANQIHNYDHIQSYSFIEDLNNSIEHGYKHTGSMVDVMLDAVD
mmetsp:Transcript_18780/g.28919  ORF Transcript_18780/g.28919 Transcript_18780/m.28919 type:complete len:91 (+) Transcript_18780:399-671(+)